MHALDEGPALAAPRARRLSDRAGDFRVILSARQEAEAILAEAHEVRRSAGLQAERLVADAEALSRDLTDQARSTLDQAIGEGREEVERILTAARASAEDIRRSARAQVAADREAFRVEMDLLRLEQASAGRQTGDDVLAAIESSIRTVEATLRQARVSASDAEVAIGLLRTETAGTQPDVGAGAAEHHFARAAYSALSTTHLKAGTPVAPDPEVPPEGSAETRPLGWLFRPDRS